MGDLERAKVLISYAGLCFIKSSHFMSLRESWGKWHESWKYDIQKVVIRESQGVIQRV